MESENFIAREKLAQLTGLTVVRLAQISSEGFFPKAIKGKYVFSEALSGLLRYYRESSEKLPVYDSIDACTGATGIPRSVLRTAKRCGCDAFSSNRVYLGKLLAWIYDPKNAKDDGDGLSIDDFKKKKVQEEVRLLVIEREEKEKALVRMDDVKKWGGEAVYAFKSEVLSLPNKLAPQVVGLSVPDAELLIRQGIYEALSRLNREPWKSQ